MGIAVDLYKGGPKHQILVYVVTLLMLGLISVSEKEAQDPEDYCSLQRLSLKQVTDRESSNRTERQSVYLRYSPMQR